VLLPFEFVRVSGRRALISGHGPQSSDGSFAVPLGKLGRDLTVEQGYAAARLAALSILGSLHRTLGDLDRISAWSESRHGEFRAPASKNSRALSTVSLI